MFGTNPKPLSWNGTSPTSRRTRRPCGTKWDNPVHDGPAYPQRARQWGPGVREVACGQVPQPDGMSPALGMVRTECDRSEIFSADHSERNALDQVARPANPIDVGRTHV